MDARRPWIASRGYDLPLIVLAPLLGLLGCAAAWLFSEPLLIRVGTIEAGFLLLGVPHYLSSFTFYMDDDNVAYYRSRWPVFFAGPAALAIVLVAALALRLYPYVASVVDLWNSYHVSRQSIGVLSMYRHRTGGAHFQEGAAANVGLLLVNFGFYIVAAIDEPNARAVLGRIPPALAPVLGPGLVALGSIALVSLVTRMLRRTTVPILELLFVASSVLLFAPYVLLDNLTLAGSLMLNGHFLQYLAIVWLLNRRKYSHPRGSWRQRALTTVSRSAPGALLALGGLGVAALVLDRGVHAYAASPGGRWLDVGFHSLALNLLVLLHFYVDGVCWAFRHPFIRSSIAPYLVGGAGAKPAAA